MHDPDEGFRQFRHTRVLTRLLTQKTSDPGALSFVKGESSLRSLESHGGKART